MYSENIKRRELYLGLIVVFMLALCQIFPNGSSVRIIKAFCDFTQIVAYPTIVVLLGSITGKLIHGKNQFIRYTMAFFELYAAQKLLLFWIKTAMNNKDCFYLFKESDSPWLFFAAAISLIVVYFIEKAHARHDVVFIISIIIGCLCGSISWVGSNFCLLRIVSFFPLFLIGRWKDSEAIQSFQIKGIKIKDLFDRLSAKIISLIFLLAVFALCFLKYKKLYSIRKFFDCSAYYADISSGLLGKLGIFVRFGWYVFVIMLVVALLVIIPDVKLPVIADMSNGWVYSYFWIRPVTIIFSTFLMEYLTTNIGKVGYIIGILAILVWTAITLTPLATKPVRWVFANANFWSDAPEDKHLDLNQSFYEKHKVAILNISCYSAAFIVIITAIINIFNVNNLSLIWEVDGLQQQYTSMLFLSRYVRNIFKTLISTGSLQIPQFTFEASYGMNVLDIVRRDPFLLLSVFFNNNSMEALYDFLSIFRMWVSGLCVLWLFIELNKKQHIENTIGALTYVFCGYSLYIMVRQPVFQTPCMIYLPLTILGVERFLTKRKKGVFVITVCLNFISGYYIAWMNAWIMALYLLIRLIYININILNNSHDRKQVKLFAKNIGLEIAKMFGMYLWGIALSAFILLPTIYSYLTSGRTGENSGLNAILFYSKSYYEKLFTDLVDAIPNHTSYWTVVSLSGIAMISLIILFIKKDKRYRPIKTAVISCFVMICVPLFGKLMNGFGYVSNRWCYAIQLLMAIVVVYMIPELIELKNSERRIILLVSVGYLAIIVGSDSDVRTMSAIGIAAFAIILLAVLLMDTFAVTNAQKRAFLAIAVTVVTAVSVSESINPTLGSYLTSECVCVQAGEAYSTLVSEDNETAALLSEIDDSFYRIELSNRRSNESVAVGYNGTTTYYSIISKGLTEMFNDFNMNTQAQSFDLRGLNSRTSLLALSSVKYYVGEENVPYGFKKTDDVEDLGGTVSVYKNKYYLPLGYTYSYYMTESAYDELNFAEKQQAILKRAVISDEDSEDISFRKKKFNSSVVELGCKVTSSEDAEYNKLDHTLSATGEEESKIKFDITKLDKLEDGTKYELYVFLDNIEIADGSSTGLTNVKVKADDNVSSARIHDKEQTYYFDNDGYSFWIGMSNKIDSFSIKFSEPAEFTLDSIKVYAIPMSEYTQSIKKLKKNVLKNVEINGDTITGTIKVSKKKLLALSIPYSKGWTIYVDGEKAELLQVNKMFMGVILPKGKHTIELRYCMPWFKVGCIISFAAVVGIVYNYVVKRSKKYYMKK